MTGSAVVAARRRRPDRIMVGIGAAVVGLDLGAALTLANALGLSFFIAAEVLSDIEPAVVSALNRAIGDR